MPVPRHWWISGHPRAHGITRLAPNEAAEWSANFRPPPGASGPTGSGAPRGVGATMGGGGIVRWVPHVTATSGALVGSIRPPPRSGRRASSSASAQALRQWGGLAQWATPPVPRGTPSLRVVLPVARARGFHVEPAAHRTGRERRSAFGMGAGMGNKNRQAEDYARPPRHLAHGVAGWRAAGTEGSGVRTEMER